MKGFLKVGLLIAVAMALFGTYRFVSAQNETSFGRIQAKAPTFNKEIRAKAPLDAVSTPLDVVSTEHILVGTYLSVGNGAGATVDPATFTPVDTTPTTVFCPGTCTILANQFVQTAGTQSGNNFGICLYVDGLLIPSGCFYSNDTLSDGTFVMGETSNWETGLPAGDHTVQTVIYSHLGCFLGEYNLQYIVYEP
jgi:hypothetical protein